LINEKRLTFAQKKGAWFALMENGSKGKFVNSRAITILLADDHTIVRQGLAKLLDGDGNLCVIGEARNGREALSKVEELKPDVVLMDFSMPILNEIEATR